MYFKLSNGDIVNNDEFGKSLERYICSLNEFFCSKNKPYKLILKPDYLYVVYDSVVVEEYNIDSFYEMYQDVITAVNDVIEQFSDEHIIEYRLGDDIIHVVPIISFDIPCNAFYSYLLKEFESD